MFCLLCVFSWVHIYWNTDWTYPLLLICIWMNTSYINRKKIWEKDWLIDVFFSSVKWLGSICACYNYTLLCFTPHVNIDFLFWLTSFWMDSEISTIFSYKHFVNCKKKNCVNYFLGINLSFATALYMYGFDTV